MKSSFKFKVERLWAVAVLLLWSFSTLLLAAPPKRQFELHEYLPQLWKLVSRHAKLVKVATGFGFTEGTVWDPRGFLYVSDEFKNKIFKVYPGGHYETFIRLGNPDGNTFDSKLQLIDCATVLRAVIRVSADGKYTILAGRYEGKRFTDPNDVVLGPDNALYFTDPTWGGHFKEPKGQHQEIPFGGVYRLGASGNVRLLAKNLIAPNGLAFSPDGKKFYVDDSIGENIHVWDFNFDGTISNDRIFGYERGTAPHQGPPDGMKVDVHGDLFVVGPMGIWVWSPKGRHLGTIVMPEQPANEAWGGKDYHTLYIAAKTSVYRIRTKVRGFVPYLTGYGEKRP